MICALHADRQAHVGRLCSPCLTRLDKMLDPANMGSVFNAALSPSIPVLYGRLDAQPGSTGLSAVSTTGFESSPPANLHVLALRDARTRARGGGADDDLRAPNSPLSVLRWSASMLGRQCPRGVDPADVQAMAAWMHLWLDELAGVELIGDVHAELRRVQVVLRHAQPGGDGGPRPVGHCWVLVDEHGREDEQGAYLCAEPLYAPPGPPRAPDEPVTLPALSCGACGHHYTGMALMQLGRMIQEQGAA